MTTAMSFLRKAILFSFLLINTCQNASSFNIKRSAPESTASEKDWFGKVEDAFHAKDQDNNGTLSMNEIMYPLSRDNLFVQRVFSIVDSDADGRVDVKELKGFSNFTLSEEGHVRLIIKFLDTSNDGFLSKEEIFDGLKMHLDAYHLEDPKLQEFVDERFAIADTNKDGILTFKEAKTVIGEGYVRSGIKVMDTSNDGFLCKEKMFERLKMLLDANDLKDPKLQEYVDEQFAIGDTNKDGILTFEEAQTDDTESDWRFLFRVSDLNENEFVNNDEALKVMKKLLSHYDAMNNLTFFMYSYFSDFDTDRDGKLNITEFYGMREVGKPNAA